MTLSYCYLHDALTGQCLGSIGYSGTGTRWEWIRARVAGEYGCEPDDVNCIETDDGDKITAGGRIVAYTAI